MEMNIGKLKKEIEKLPDDMPVFVACQGYCNYFDCNNIDVDTFAIIHNGKLFITDQGAVEIDGKTI